MKHKKTIELLTRGVCVKEGRLLVCQSRGSGNTYLPGGHVEWMEKAEAALKREIEEELGVQSAVREFLGSVEHTFMQKNRRHCEINLMFRMEISALSPDRDPVSCEEWISFTWIPLSSLGRHHLEPSPLRKLIPAWITAETPTPRWGTTLD